MVAVIASATAASAAVLRTAEALAVDPEASVVVRPAPAAAGALPAWEALVVVVAAVAAAEVLVVAAAVVVVVVEGGNES